MSFLPPHPESTYLKFMNSYLASLHPEPWHPHFRRTHSSTSHLVTLNLVNQVHWIRARAQKNRWKEEFTLTGYEMEWTVRYYLHQARIWETRRDMIQEGGDQGARTYAARKAAMWMEIARSADIRFKSINRSYSCLVTP
jgi:hypothetical protein